MRVAVIPARGGSKRIPGKNIKPFAGRPIMAYSIQAALESGVFERVIVSTDSESYAEVARREGAEVPFLRPPGIADDRTPLVDVLEHALLWLKGEGTPAEYAGLVYSTAPFVRPADIRRGYEMIREHGTTAVLAVTTFAFPIYRAFGVEPDGSLKMLWPEHEFTHSNQLPEVYHDAAHFYWLDAEAFLKERRIYAANSRPLVVPRYLVQDIDRPEDWERAELMYRAYAATLAAGATDGPDPTAGKIS